MEVLGPGKDSLNSAPSRRVVRPTIRRALTVVAIATLLAVVPSVAEGVRVPSGTHRQAAPASRTPTQALPAGGHAAATNSKAVATAADSVGTSASRSGGHAIATGTAVRAGTTDTHAPQLTGSTSTVGQATKPAARTGTQGGHQTAFVLKPSYSRLDPSEQALWLTRRGPVSGVFPALNSPEPAVMVGGGASRTGGSLLPHTSATSDQRIGSTRASTTLPVISITIGRRASSRKPGGVVDGAGFGPVGGTVDVTVRSPDTNPPVAPVIGSPDAPVSDVAIDLSGLFATQFDGSLFATANCNMAAGAMLFEVQTGLNVTGGQMRAWSGATTRGTSLEDLARGFASQGQPLSIHRYMPWSEFQRKVASGRSAVVQGWYGYLPRHYVLQPGFVAGHSVFVLGYSPHVFGGRGGFYVMDPLGRAGYSGKWWPSDVLRAYGWSGKPGHAGDGTKLSYLGFVAFQANRSGKQPMSAGRPAGRPAFQSYWQTTKAALEAALKVVIISGHGANLPALRGVVLLIRDPRLALTAALAEELHALRWPVAGNATIARGFSARHPDLELAPGRGSNVLAAANGRVIFESWRNGSGTQTIWIEHGLDLFTAYSGLRHVNVKPGQWVSTGDLLGSMAGSKGALLFSVSVGALPTSTRGHVDPARFLPLS